MEWTIAGMAALVALALIAPLFSYGHLLNIDNPPHLVRINCLSESGIAPNNWCPDINGGLPTSQYYYPPVDQLLAFFPLEFGGHLAVALGYLLPGIGAWFFLRRRGYPIAGALAMLFSFVHTGSWHFGGAQEAMLVGFWHYMITVGASFICMAFFLDYLSQGRKWDFVAAVVATLFLAHPMSILVSAFFFIALAIAYYRTIQKHYLRAAYFVAAAAGINAYYWIPLFAKLHLFGSSPSGGISWDQLVTYFWSAMPWFMTLLALIGVGFIIYRQDRAISALVIAGIILLFLNLIPNPLHKVLVGLRTGPFLAAIYLMLAGLGVDFVRRINIPPYRNLSMVVASLVVALVIIPQFGATQEMVGSLLHTDQEWFQPHKQLFERLDQLPPGRILTEETLYNFGQGPQSLTHLQSMIPLYTDKEIIAFSTTTFFPTETRLNNLDKGDLWGKPIGEWDPHVLNSMFDGYNVRYALAHSAPWRQFFDEHADILQDYGAIALYALNRTPGYAEGPVESIDYQGRAVQVKTQGTGMLRFRVNYYPNWYATIDGQPAPITSCHERICIAIPEGVHTVRLRYGVLWYEWLAYLLSLATLCFLFKQSR